MKIDTEIYEGKLILNLSEVKNGQTRMLSRCEIEIEELFDEMKRINEERRIEAAREVTRANYRPRR